MSGVADIERATVPIVFAPRDEPLLPCAAYAFDSAGAALARRLLGSSDASLRLLTGVASSRLVLVVGPETELPWVPGVSYLGRDDAEPALLVPTALTANVSVELLAEAVFSRLGRRESCALLPEPPLLVPLGRALTLSRAQLGAWLEKFEALT